MADHVTPSGCAARLMQRIRNLTWDMRHSQALEARQRVEMGPTPSALLAKRPGRSVVIHEGGTRGHGQRQGRRRGCRLGGWEQAWGSW